MWPWQRCPEHLVWPTSLAGWPLADPVSQGSAKLGQEDIGHSKVILLDSGRRCERADRRRLPNHLREVVLLIRFKSRRAEYRLAWPYALTANWYVILEN